MVAPWRRRSSPKSSYTDHLFGLMTPTPGRIYIIPTRMGAYHLGGALMGIIVALSYANPLAIFFIFLWFAFLLLSAVLSHQLLMRADWQQWILDWRWREDEGPRFQAPYGPELWDIFVDIEHDLVREKNWHCLNQITDLPPGIHRIRLVKIISRAPLGIFQTWTFRSGQGQDIMILPVAQDYGVKAPLMERQRHRPIEGLAQAAQGEDASSGFPVALDYFTTAFRLHWRRLAMSDRPVAIRPDPELSLSGIIELDAIALQDEREKVRQAMAWLQISPRHWRALRLPDGQTIAANAQLPQRLAHFLSDGGRR